MLPAYNSLNGMTDGWGELLNALKALTLSQEPLLPEERITVAALKQAAQGVLQARLCG